MRSRTPKVLHPLCGRPMLAYVLDAWEGVLAETTGSSRSPAGDEPPTVVYSPATEALREVVADRARLALQARPQGTGDAVAAALAVVPADADEIVVLSGDVPLVEPEQLIAVLEQRRLDDAAIALASVFAADPAELGRVVRGEFGTVERIVEARDASPDDLDTNEVNAGLYAFDAAWLRRRIGDLTPSPSNGELYLTDLVAMAREDGRIVSAVGFDDDGTFDGINDRSQLAQAEWAMRVRINERHMRAGVTMRDPSTVYIDADVTIGQDVVIEPNVLIVAGSSIADGCTIGPGATIHRSSIGEGSLVTNSVVEGSTTGRFVSIGPFSHIRPGSEIGDLAEIGNYAEVKNSRIGEGVKSHHVSYLGDAELGAGTNVGAGTITANWDGTRKNRTLVGPRAFLGVDTMLVAPVTVGEGARTGAGAVVTKDVPPGKLAVGVPARMREPRPRPDPDPGSGSGSGSESGSESGSG
jgi:bifunctional UDP-N-acetylglucosamine pyrophosphorylase/glucosamine-1-phosphate N-acetyltransferase